MANKDKGSNTQPYIKVGSKKVSTNEEQARDHMQAQWREQKVQEREQKCLTETGARCTKDCSQCNKERKPILGSLDALIDAGYNPSVSFDMTELVAEKILLRELALALDELNPQNRKIAEMVGQGYTEREIAPEVGLSQKGVNKRKFKIFDQLRERLKGFR